MLPKQQQHYKNNIGAEYSGELQLEQFYNQLYICGDTDIRFVFCFFGLVSNEH